MGGKGGNKTEVMDWSDTNEASFLLILYERVKKDPSGTLTFKMKDWQEMDEEIFLKCGVRYEPDRLTGKYNRLRRKYHDFCELLERTGVTYDISSNIVFADENTWQQLCTKGKNFKAFKKFGCKNFELLGQVFGRSIATGHLHHASNQLLPNSDEEREIEEQFLSGNAGPNEVENSSARSSKRKRLTDECFPGNTRVIKQSKTIESKLESCLEMWNVVLSARVEIEKAKVKKYKFGSSEVTSHVFDPYSMMECVKMLDSMDDVSNSSFNNAIAKFTLLEWRQAFLTMSDARKKAWLKSLE